MEPWIKLKTNNGNEISLTDKISGLYYLGVDDASSSPQFTNNYQDSSGKDGSFFVSQTLAKRQFTEKFNLEVTSWEEFQLAKHEIYRLFGQRKLMRVRTDASPGKVYYGYANPFDITIASSGAWYSNFSIPFDVPSGYRMSMYRSDELDKYGLGDDGWQFGMNLPDDLDSVKYHFNSSNFQVYNASDIKVDPYYQNHDLQMQIKFSGSSLQVTNHTTNTSWKFNESSDGNHSIIWDGQNLTTYLDGVQVNGKTDFGYISLEPGWNNIECSGANSVDITFSFPFLYML